MKTTIHVGDALSVLRTLPDESVHCITTSPPYYLLRIYTDDDPHEIGREQTPEDFVANLVEVFREARRVLRHDGTLFLNLGDSFAGNGGGGQGSGGCMAGRSITEERGRGAIAQENKRGAGLKNKDLIGIPWMVAFALRADGWWLRSDNVWAKGTQVDDEEARPRGMPESIEDRPRRNHEFVFMLTKSATYFYDWVGVREKALTPAGTRAAKGGTERGTAKGVNSRMPKYATYDGYRNLASVWWIPPMPSDIPHYALMPPALAERCIRSGTSEHGCCGVCGAPYERVLERKGVNAKFEGTKAAHLRESGQSRVALSGSVERTSPEIVTLGYKATCECVGAPVVPCRVLDPFGGAGTTALVANRLGRDAALIELNPVHAETARKRLEHDLPMFSTVELVQLVHTEPAAPAMEHS